MKKSVDEKFLSEMEELKVRCTCGHTMILPVYTDKTICTYCGKTNYNNTRLHFKYKIRKLMRGKNES